jgi:hypothetical protein
MRKLNGPLVHMIASSYFHERDPRLARRLVVKADARSEKTALHVGILNAPMLSDLFRKMMRSMQSISRTNVKILV